MNGCNRFHFEVRSGAAEKGFSGRRAGAAELSVRWRAVMASAESIGLNWKTPEPVVRSSRLDVDAVSRIPSMQADGHR